MFTAKIIASLFLIATAGLLDAGRGRVGEGDARRVGDTTSTAAPVLAGRATPMAASSLGDIRREVARALAVRVRKDLDDPGLAVDVSGLSLRRESEALVSVDGEARVSLGAGGALPLHVEADWDASGQQVARLDYRVDGAAIGEAPRAVDSIVAPDPAMAGPASAEPALGQRLRAAIETRLNEGIAREFAQQHPRFELVSVEDISSGRYRMLVTGTGITRFPGEGAAFTRFSASVGKFDGRVAQADYELLQELDPASPEPPSPASPVADPGQLASR